MAPGGHPRLCLFGGLYYLFLQGHGCWVKCGQGGSSTAQCWSKDMALWLGSIPKEYGAMEWKQGLKLLPSS